MIRTIIVDDDYLVRMFLLAVTDWEKEGFEIVDNVQDGEQALEIIERLRPELVITDISMPVMDGISLIKEIKKRDFFCKIIVLSCHDDFDYVKEALKEGADDYILKNSFNKKNIDSILENLRSKVEEGRQEIREKAKLLHLADLGSNELKKKFLINVINNKYNYEQLKGKSANNDIRISLLKTAVIEIKILLTYKPNDKSDQQKQAEIFNDLIGMSKNIIDTKYKYEIIATKDFNYTIIIDAVSISSHEVLNEIATKIHIFIEEHYKLKSVIGVSDICIGKDSLKNAFSHAQKAIERSFYNENEIFYHELKSIIYKEKCYTRFYDDIKKLLITVDIEEILKKSKEQIDYFEREHINPQIVIEWLKKMDDILKVARENQIYEHITSIEQVKSMVDDYREHINYYPNISVKITNIIVAKAIQHINNNYDKTISLTSVADYLQVNSTYLSRLFKQETKMNFTDYLAIVRIDNAKSLLSSTDKKIKDIAKLCGFYDYRYFCKIFKKIVGRNPMSYRKFNN
ncbi:DNA-binding response regulator [Vallitalea longa]|uniref:Stage 0 sporulation protein A homolog n=1 Tax=Vallitalea longa TaxID=2936439 RepID=A0A9W6DFC5_9FIRM|nr:response regulator [Vallitalea longa]GKX29313.1 DNA-binding response regulator [Vallitalea longa]